ncbi:hypothetical protein [Cryobacterium sp. TMT1-3]|uniref:hypothetical protein n=1 Tax=Cryobacterium sp. TMT1-3 TaxID=1259237 RepID=UPI0018E07914|nr:hypothetical protein [Cryobacterium sp. TMT1-3]
MGNIVDVANLLDTKVTLLVAADPDSLSGKARKARDYGIPIVGETAMARLAGAFPPR